MLDFTSSLFLDWRHRQITAPGEPSLTSGRPAAMHECPQARALAARVARSQGTDAGVVHRSALHGLIDTIDLAATRAGVVLLDRAAYPTAFTAAAGVAARGIALGTYRHHDVADLDRAADAFAGPPVVITDGWCGGCGRPAPLPELEHVTAARGGMLIVDDTQALGVIGSGATAKCPFGQGGGGTYRWLGATPRHAVLVASLAKAYGAPLAVTTGPTAFIHRLGGHGSRWQASPPTTVDLTAATRATTDTHGNTRRRHLLTRLVVQLRAGLRAVGLPVIGLPFPLVSVALTWPDGAARVHRRLARIGVQTLLITSRCQRISTLTFAVTTTHTTAQIDQVLTALEFHQAQAWAAS